jgi:hypothetical protein
MTDRELLENAAKAAGIPLKADFAKRFDYYMADPLMWNPLKNDGDALRLAVQLRLHVDHTGDDVTVWVANKFGATLFRENEITESATRRAIVRAAAAMDVEKPQV